MFPEELIEPFVKACTEPGDIVLDPFAGSGTTGEVAIKYGCYFVGYEINGDFCRLCVAASGKTGASVKRHKGSIVDRCLPRLAGSPENLR